MDINNIRYNNQKIRNLVLEYTSKHKGETQRSVAEKIGVALTTLFYKNPTVDTLCKAADFFQCDINCFFEIPESIIIESAKRSLASSPKTEYASENEKRIQYLERSIEEMGEEMIQVKELIKSLINKNNFK